MPSKRKPMTISHPSVFIREEMKARGYSLNDVTFRMRRYESEKDWQIERLALELYLEVQTPNMVLSRTQARGLGAAFGVSAKLFENMHSAWRKSVTSQPKK